MTKIATRRINKFDFSGEGAHVAVVDAAANEQTVLVMKAATEDKMVDAFDMDSVSVSKALEQVTVKMSMEEFLRKFFDMWHSDAEMLTKLLGFETEWEAFEKEINGEVTTQQGFLEERLESFSIMKSLYDSDVQEIASSDYINIVKTQELFEQTPTKPEKEENMTDKVIEKTEGDEVSISKSEFADLKKSLDALQKHNDVLVTEREATIEKALAGRVDEFSFVEDKEGLVALVKQMDDEAQEVIFSTLTKATEAIAAIVTEPMAIEGEAVLKAAGDKDVEALDSAIAKKYTLSK
jgi:hypothetical protein